MGVTMLAVAGITGIMGAVSYQHEYELARHHGQAPWVSSVLPFTVDGLIFAASVVILWANSQGIRRPLRPMAVLAVGVGATIAANLAAGIGDGWLGAAISAWSGVALILISDVAMWLLGTLRALAKGEPVHPAAACSCPPPPVTLEEALPLARARLQEDGQPYGKEALAARFKTTPHQVRAALAPAVTSPPAGAGMSDPDRSPAGALERGRDGYPGGSTPPAAAASAPPVPATQPVLNGHGGAGG